MQHAWQARETKKRPKKKLTFISYMDMHTRNMDTTAWNSNMTQLNGTATLHSHMKQPHGTHVNMYI